LRCQMKKRLALYSFCHGQPVFLVVVSVYGLVCANSSAPVSGRRETDLFALSNEKGTGTLFVWAACVFSCCVGVWSGLRPIAAHLSAGGGRQTFLRCQIKKGRALYWFGHGESVFLVVVSRSGLVCAQ
jgi:hypothetical protein